MGLALNWSTPARFCIAHVTPGVLDEHVVEARAPDVDVADPDGEVLEHPRDERLAVGDAHP